MIILFIWFGERNLQGLFYLKTFNSFGSAKFEVKILCSILSINLCAHIIFKPTEELPSNLDPGLLGYEGTLPSHI